MIFEWDEAKNVANVQKHGVSFEVAQTAFADPARLVFTDLRHSKNEARFFCYGMVDGRVMTVRFTLRKGSIRLFGAAYWRKGREEYETRNQGR